MLKKLAVIASLAIAFGDVEAAFASVEVGETVKLTRGSNHGTGGGAFNVENISDTDTPDFATFCVEIFEHINLGSTYYVYNISNQNDINGGHGIRTLGSSAAWLYTQFREGDITLTDPNSTTARNLENALQLGIWRGMLADVNNPNSGYSNAEILSQVGGQQGWNISNYITSVLDPILSGWLTTFASDQAWKAHGATYTGGVQIMNLKTSPTGTRSQDQLIWEEVPDQTRLDAPEPATLAVWSGLVAVGFMATWKRTIR
jgi:hypothetical protein